MKNDAVLRLFSIYADDLYRFALSYTPKYKKNVDIDALGDVIGVSVDYSKDDDSLFKALSQMDEIYRMPIYLHYYEGYSHKEISGILKVSEAAIAKRISRGKEELRKRLEE